MGHVLQVAVVADKRIQYHYYYVSFLSLCKYHLGIVPTSFSSGRTEFHSDRTETDRDTYKQTQTGRQADRER